MIGPEIPLAKVCRFSSQKTLKYLALVKMEQIRIQQIMGKRIYERCKYSNCKILESQFFRRTKITTHNEPQRHDQLGGGFSCNREHRRTLASFTAENPAAKRQSEKRLYGKPRILQTADNAHQPSTTYWSLSPLR